MNIITRIKMYIIGRWLASRMVGDDIINFITSETKDKEKQ